MNRVVALLLISLGLESCTAGLDILIRPVVKAKTITLNVSNYNLIKNFSMTFVPTFKPQNPINAKFVLTSSAPNIIKVSGSRITSLIPGTATVTATAAAGGLTAVATINAVDWSPLSLSGSVTHFAGSNDSIGSADGAGTSSRFFHPCGVCVVGTNLFIADSDNSTIRQLNLNTLSVTTLAGMAGSSNETDGTGTAARFAHPGYICSDGTNLYVADSYGNTIRKIVIATGVTTTLAGGPSGSADGTGTAAQFAFPIGICIDSSNANLYVTDTNNHSIRKIVIATAAVTTLAGYFPNPQGIATDGSNLYVCDDTNSTIQKVVLSTGTISTLVGSNSGFADGTGTSAQLTSPWGISCDGSNLYFSDQYGGMIRKVVLSSLSVSTLAGVSGGTGQAAEFDSAQGVAFDGTNLYVADAGNNNRIRKIAPPRSVITLAGQSAEGTTDGIGTAARFNHPPGICSDQTSLFVTDQGNRTIRRVSVATGEVTTFVGSSGIDGNLDGVGTKAQLSGLRSTCTDGVSLFFIDQWGGALRRVIIGTGMVTTMIPKLPSDSGLQDARGVCTDGTFVYITLGSGSILKVSVDNGSSTTLANGLNDPSDLCTDGSSLYVAEGTGNRIIRVDPASGTLSILAGSGNGGDVDGTGTSAQFDRPHGICTDGTSLYVSEEWGGMIRKVVIASGVVTSPAGGGFGESDGVGSTVGFLQPLSICSVNSHLFVVEGGNSCIREIQ